jgi:23S rRNA (cytosine1962-C5)-methyltransferase
MNINEFLILLQKASVLRSGWMDERHLSAFRLYNGFIEGFPDLAIDIYARTAVIYNYANPSDVILELINPISNFLNDLYPWIQTVVVKTRFSPDLSARHGLVVYGEQIDARVRELGIWYAINLQLTSDSSLYLDTRYLREWIKQYAENKLVLNTFAYTGSLGVAAKAGGARQVIHLDKSRKSLNLAKTSYLLNGFPIIKTDFLSEDFFIWTSRLRRSKQRFDMVFLDPPFFSQTSAGKVDLNTQYSHLVNKIRPLLVENGYIIAINNALFVSGSTFITQLEEICLDGYLRIEELIPVSPDFSGYPEMRLGSFPADPQPFNHPTKIAVLKVLKVKSPSHAFHLDDPTEQ